MWSALSNEKLHLISLVMRAKVQGAINILLEEP
jgi:hypothetical protein